MPFPAITGTGSKVKSPQQGYGQKKTLNNQRRIVFDLKKKKQT